MLREISEVLLCKGNIIRWICAIFCIFFIVTSVVALLLVFLAPSSFAWLVGAETLTKTEVICVCIFASIKIVSCLFIISNLRGEKQHAILFWIFVNFAIWHVPFVWALMNISFYVLRTRKQIYLLEPLVIALPSLVFQCVWLSFIMLLWYYWQQLSLQPDIPCYVYHLRKNTLKKRALREDLEERLGEDPPKFLTNLDAPGGRVATADVE